MKFSVIKKNPKRFLRYIALKFLKVNKNSKKLLLIPSYITFIIIVFAITLAFSKGFNKLSLNEIGDFFAGFAGVLAFLWIIITVLLQNRDLNLQYQEIKDMRAASESQARSLLSAETFKALEYINQQFDKRRDYLVERRDYVDQVIKDFMVKYPSDRKQDESFKAKLDISEVWGYFRKPDIEVKSLFLNLDDIKSDFDYEAFLKLQTINDQIERALNTIDAMLINISPEIEDQILKSTRATESQLMIEWYREYSPFLRHLENSVRDAIVKHKIGSEFNRQIIELYQKEERG